VDYFSSRQREMENKTADPTQGRIDRSEIFAQGCLATAADDHQAAQEDE
jgi:hypothetical protein